MFNHLGKKIFLLMLFMLLVTGSASAIEDNNLSNTQLNSVMGIVTNLVLSSMPQPAFYGAEGGGAESKGGRGGKIYEVINLNDEGPGSLRYGVKQSGKRIIIFKISGEIRIDKAIVIKNPYISILGQSAPEGGITIAGNEISIVTHDVIIRYIRVRTGRQDKFTYQQGDSIGMGDNSYNTIIDHCSLSWSNDENGQVWSYSNPSYNVTWSRNIISEGLTYNHASSGLITGSSTNVDGMTNIDVHHNIFAHFNNRMPLIKVKSSRVINNLVYDWVWYPTGVSGGASVDIIGNKYIPGPNTPKTKFFAVAVRTDKVLEASNLSGLMFGPTGKPSIYISDNSAPDIQAGEDNWKSVRAWDNKDWPTIEESDYRRLTKLANTTFPITINKLEEVENNVINDSGANKRITAKGLLVDSRDSIDARIIQEYRTRTGVIPTDETDVGGYINVTSKTGYIDSDHDGISDEWEVYYGLNPNDSNDGFNHLEDFLSGRNPIK